MNFGTFLGCMFLIIFWHVVHAIYKYFEIVLYEIARPKLKEYAAISKEKRELEEKMKNTAGTQKCEKRTIGFQTGEVVNEKEGS